VLLAPRRPTTTIRSTIICASVVSNNKKPPLAHGCNKNRQKAGLFFPHKPNVIPAAAVLFVSLLLMSSFQSSQLVLASADLMMDIANSNNINAAGDKSKQFILACVRIN
jgi:hypothetical protein